MFTCVSEPRDCSRVCHVIDLSAVELSVQLQQWATRLRLYFSSLSTTAVAKTRQSSTHAKLSRKRYGFSYLPSKGVHCLHAARTQVPLRFFGAPGVGPGVGARLDCQISECLHNFSTAHYAFFRSRSLGQQDLRLLLCHCHFQVRSTSSSLFEVRLGVASQLWPGIDYVSALCLVRLGIARWVTSVHSRFKPRS